MNVHKDAVDFLSGVEFLFSEHGSELSDRYRTDFLTATNATWQKSARRLTRLLRKEARTEAKVGLRVSALPCSLTDMGSEIARQFSRGIRFDSVDGPDGLLATMQRRRRGRYREQAKSPALFALSDRGIDNNESQPHPQTTSIIDDGTMCTFAFL